MWLSGPAGSGGRSLDRFPQAESPTFVPVGVSSGYLYAELAYMNEHVIHPSHTHCVPPLDRALWGGPKRSASSAGSLTFHMHLVRRLWGGQVIRERWNGEHSVSP